MPPLQTQPSTLYIVSSPDSYTATVAVVLQSGAISDSEGVLFNTPGAFDTEAHVTKTARACKLSEKTSCPVCRSCHARDDRCVLVQCFGIFQDDDHEHGAARLIAAAWRMHRARAPQAEAQQTCQLVAHVTAAPDRHQYFADLDLAIDELNPLRSGSGAAANFIAAA
eukprot:6046065-Prymnesium_polylepis.1